MGQPFSFTRHEHMHVEPGVQAEYRKLPAVDRLLHEPAIQVLAAEYGHPQVVETIRMLLAQARQAVASGQPARTPEHWPAWIEAALQQAQTPSLRPVINASGVIIHTNLGRAPLSQAAGQAMVQVGSSYSNLEYNLDAGERGSRHDHARTLLCELTGAEDAMIVNNNAAAIYLVLAALCVGRQVLISRGQLVEIGGGFRIPDVLRQSGAQLMEVGTTNRTHLRDFADAITAETAAIMRVHSSNFRQVGFVTMPELAELAEIVRQRNELPIDPVLLIDDLGSGTLLDTSRFGLAAEPMVQTSVAAGADLITFSGDKLLGGPQAGLIVGRRTWIERLRRHPMARALRVDKLTLAALDATLRSYQRGQALAEIPVWQMISASRATLSVRATNWQRILTERGISSHVQEGESAVGGGSLPGETLPTVLLAVAMQQPDQVAAALRRHQRPVVCRIQRDLLLFDPRTVLAHEEGEFLQALLAVLSNQ